MFNAAAFDNEIDDLIQDGQAKIAEERLLRAYSELKTAGHLELERVVSRMAHFYSMPGTENQERAEAYFLEREALRPDGLSKWGTAMFYFYVVGDPQKTIRKVDEIKLVQADRAIYYSALSLKGQSFIKLEMFSDADSVLEELLDLIKTNAVGLPYGDEMNLLESASQIALLTPKCQEVLDSIMPKIRSREYRERAKALLGRDAST